HRSRPPPDRAPAARRGRPRDRGARRGSREVAEVAALARGDEAHGDGVVRRVLAALMAVAAVLALELILRARETAAALADEPARKLERAYADARERSAHVAF